ncbi:GIDE domain-containing protein [Natronomonas amylolytica]|uniref:GIDE domain-containing protein n=1 Tax=Natronomonas amylolytica TaxID=3108498 RepID=UPI00300AA133
MAAVSDLKRRTGVGAGGILLYVVCVAAGVAVAGRYGQIDWTDGNPLVFLAGLLYAVGLLGVVSAVSNFPRHLLVAVGRRRGATDGLTAVTGTVEPTGGTLTAPLHDAPAVCYTYRILDETDDDGDTSADEQDDEQNDDELDEANWSLATMGENGVRFTVYADGGTERVRVDPTAAAYHIDDRTEVVVETGEHPSGGAEALRQEADIAPAPRDSGRRYQEATLAPGEEAFVLGRARSEGGLRIADGTPFVVADADYPSRLRGRVTVGFVAGVPVSALGFAAMLFAAGAL